VCSWGEYEEVLVKIPAGLAFSGKAYWTTKKIDRCIAPIVKALQKGGIDMRSSCCGHGKKDGKIELQDGRTLIIRGEKR